MTESGDEKKWTYPRAPLGSELNPANRRPGRRQAPEHPENDLADDADYANLVPPEPRDFDELADQEDPLITAEKNRRSTRQAWQYVLTAVVTTFVFGLLVALIFRLTSSAEQCQAFEGRLLCSPTKQNWWALLVSLPPIGFLFGSMYIMIKKLRSYTRWRPWMGVFWTLVPFTMWVLTVTVQVYLSETGAL